MQPQSTNLMALLTMAPSAFAGGDMPRLPKIKSLAALREEVKRHFGKLSYQEQEALAAWFNRNFFRLEQ
jgi:hypothetical protein